MKETLIEGIENVNLMIQNNKYQSAIKLLRQLSNEYSDAGIVPYYFGKLCIIEKDERLALKYFLSAEKLGYSSTEFYLSLAMLQNRLALVDEAEKSFLKAIDFSEDEKEKWTCVSEFAIFCVEHGMYLKAEKAAKSLIEEYPNNYQGYHVHVIKEAIRGHFDEANVYMDKIPDKFKNHPQYLMDLIELYKLQDKKEELQKLFDEDSRFTMVIPQIVLREKISGLSNDKFDIKERLIRQLAKEYHDSDAIVSLMILEFSRNNYKKSSKIANVVLENEKENQGLKYYLALYFQIFNFYFLSGKRPSLELRKWIEDAGNWCVKFADDLNIPEIGNPIRDSIQGLFEELNYGSLDD